MLTPRVQSLYFEELHQKQRKLNLSYCEIPLHIFLNQVSSKFLLFNSLYLISFGGYRLRHIRKGQIDKSTFSNKIISFF